MSSSRATNPTLDLLRNQAFPELAAALRSRSATILERWQAAVRELLPTAEELTLAQLRNSIPLVIDQIIEALEADEPDPTDRLLEISKPHGETALPPGIQRQRGLGDRIPRASPHHARAGARANGSRPDDR